MTVTPADLAYARYMLQWLEELDWPAMPMADAAMTALVNCWRESQDMDLDAVAAPLWAWVDANKVPALPAEKAMIRVRMLICLCSTSNRELEQVGYFEDLLGSCGVSPSQILRSRSDHGLGDSDGRDAQVVDKLAHSGAALSPQIVPQQQAKTRVLWAFATLSFLSGARPMGSDSAQTVETLLIFSMALLIYLWYRFDSDQYGFQRTPLLNIGMIMLSAVAMPYYLIQTRGWPGARSSILKAIAVFFGSMMLSMLGMILFGDVAAAS